MLLEAALFEISDTFVTEEEVIQTVYSRSNPIEYNTERSLEEAISGTHEILSMGKGLRRSDLWLLYS